MTRVDDDPWTTVAQEWASRWGGFAAPAQRVVLTAAHVGPGVRVLDVGCGSGEFLALAVDAGAVVTGVDPSAGMVRTSRATAPGVDVRRAEAENLPFGDATFDVVTAFNTLQFTADVDDAVAELARVLVTGGRLAVAGWAEGSRNDLDRVESAVSEHHGEEPREDRDLSREGELAELLTDAGLSIESSGVVDVPWAVDDDESLVRGVLLGEDEAGLATVGPVVVAAAQPFRRRDGGYVLRNAFRWVVGVGP